MFLTIIFTIYLSQFISGQYYHFPYQYNSFQQFPFNNQQNYPFNFGHFGGRRQDNYPVWNSYSDSANAYANSQQFPPITTSSRINNRPSTTKVPEIEKRISEIKCEEYEKLTFEKSYGGSLALDSKPKLILSSKCSRTTSFIVGGSKAAFGEFPHMVSIGFGREGASDYKYICGGSLISDRYVLTAAHCNKKHQEFGEPRVVQMNTIELNSSRSEIVSIAEFIKYDKFNSLNNFGDIALIKLANIVTFSDSLRPACLKTKNSNLAKTNKAIATGYGDTEFRGSSSEKSSSSTLLKVSLDIFPLNKCKEHYTVFDEQICSGLLEGGKDTCQGDSGGPLQVPKNGNSCLWFLIGITSHGDGCGFKNTPALYTKIEDFLDWIEPIVWK